jgi:hypothetical protein
MEEQQYVYIVDGNSHLLINFYTNEAARCCHHSGEHTLWYVTYNLVLLASDRIRISNKGESIPQRDFDAA